MLLLPYAEGAILELRKLEGYCLDPGHPRGRHKAKVFREVLGIGRDDAQWLRTQLLDGVRRRPAMEVANDLFGSRWRVDVSIERHSENAVIRTIWIIRMGERTPRFVTCWVL